MNSRFSDQWRVQKRVTNLVPKKFVLFSINTMLEKMFLFGDQVKNYYRIGGKRFHSSAILNRMHFEQTFAQTDKRNFWKKNIKKLSENWQKISKQNIQICCSMKLMSKIKIKKCFLFLLKKTNFLFGHPLYI